MRRHAAFAAALLFTFASIASAATIGARVKGIGGNPNPNSPSPGSGPYFGDIVVFTSNPSPLVDIIWNFGDGVTATTTPGNYDVGHQFGASNPRFPAIERVTATSASESTLVDSVPLIVSVPGVRVGIRGAAGLLGAEPEKAPIVTTDAFVDASDGTIESHFDEWSFDGAPARQSLPSAPQSVGTCGVHTLDFTAHYGAYDAANVPFQSISGDARYSLSGLRYTVRPFGFTISGPTAVGSNVMFAAVPRVSSDTAVLPYGSATQASFLWELVGGDGSTLFSSQGTASLSGIPQFAIPSAQFPATPSRVRLTAVANASSVAISCQPYATATALTLPVAPPSPIISVSGCTTVNAPCSLYVDGGIAQPGYSYEWSVTGPGPIPPATGTATFNPHLVVPGSYVVSVLETNTLGSTVATATLNVAAAVCTSTPTTTNTSIAFTGPASGCIPGVGACVTGEPIAFRAVPFGWTFSGCETFAWDFGDGTASTSPAPVHQYASPGTYAVRLTINGGGSTAVLTASVQAFPSAAPACAPLTPSSVAINFAGASTGCMPGAGACAANEPVTFSALGQNGYALTCLPYTYRWNFGDGSPRGSGSPITHIYATAGSYPVTLTITDRNEQTVGVTQTVQIGASQPSPSPPKVPPPNPCGTMTTSNVFIAYTGNTTHCPFAGACQVREQIDFVPVSFGYSFACGQHTFTWDFGDGSTATSGNPATPVPHVYGSGGRYTVRLTINNGVQRFEIVQSLTIEDPTGWQPPCASEAACLNASGRYEVKVVAKDLAGKTSAATAVAQRGPFGYFSFPAFTGDASNPEVFVKVLEPSAGKPWVFYAGLTNLDYTITVRDVAPGGTFNRSYHVAPPPFGSSQSFGDFDVDGIRSGSCLPVAVEKVLTEPPPACAADTSSLCLLDRFRVTLQATDSPLRASGGLPKSGAGVAIPVNDLFGFFSVPAISSDPTNVETFVKMVDARAFNGRVWVFLGGLTDMKLVLTVTDTLTGAQNIYTKPAVSTCGWNDITAF